MTRILIAAALWAASFAVPAATYYVRTDGNSACTGLADAAYTSGTACAKATPGQGIAAMAGGDTLIIRNGSYSITASLTPPSGTSSAPTRILGEQHTTCRVKPELWGTGGLNRIFDLSGRGWVEVGCLEITDHSSCVYGHPTLGCGGSSTHARDGIYAKTSNNLTFRDLHIHGLENAYRGGSVNTMTWERVRMIANAKAGFHGSTGCSSSTFCDSFTGTHTFRSVEIAWNGCGENYPLLAIHGCYGAGRGGYGDGLGTYYTEGVWIIEDSLVHHNTSDGLDLRYTDHPNADIQIRRSWFYANAGNQIKAWGKVLIENTYANSWCGFFGSRYGTDGNGAADPEPCRASGNTIAIFPDNCTGTCATIRYSTIAGHSEALIQFGLDGNTVSGYDARIENSVIVGGTSYRTGSTPKYISNSAGVSYSQHNNHVTGASSVSCTSSECVNSSPMLRNQSITAFDPRPQATSPILGAGSRSFTTPATDITGRARPTAPARGAFEYAP